MTTPVPHDVPLLPDGGRVSVDLLYRVHFAVDDLMGMDHSDLDWIPPEFLTNDNGDPSLTDVANFLERLVADINEAKETHP